MSKILPFYAKDQSTKKELLRHASYHFACSLCDCYITNILTSTYPKINMHYNLIDTYCTQKVVKYLTVIHLHKHVLRFGLVSFQSGDKKSCVFIVCFLLS